MSKIQINKSCHDLYSGRGYNYSMSLPESPHVQDCDHTWIGEDGTVLGHGSFLVRDYCQRGICHVVRCLNPSTLMPYIFNGRFFYSAFHSCTPIFNSSISTPEAANFRERKNTTEPLDPQESHITTVAIILLVFMIGFLIIVCQKRKRIARGWVRLVSGCRQQANENIVAECRDSKSQ